MRIRILAFWGENARVWWNEQASVQLKQATHFWLSMEILMSEKTAEGV
jgi:hypothetical protein